MCVHGFQKFGENVSPVTNAVDALVINVHHLFVGGIMQLVEQLHHFLGKQPVVVDVFTRIEIDKRRVFAEILLL